MFAAVDVAGSSEQGVADVGFNRQHGSKADHRCARVHELRVGGERAEGLLLGAEAGGDQRCRDEQGEEGKDSSGLLSHLAENALTCKRGEDQGGRGKDRMGEGVCRTYCWYRRQ